MKMRKQRLENTRFFEDREYAPESHEYPGRRNLKIAVKEERTGQYPLSAPGFSSVEKAVVYRGSNRIRTFSTAESFLQGRRANSFRIKDAGRSYSRSDHVV